MSDSVIRRAFVNMKRSGWRAYAVIFMMSTTFVILGLLLVIIYTSNNLATYFMQKTEVIGFFQDVATEEQILIIKNDLESRSYVARIRYVSKEEAMKIFLENNKDNQEIVEGVTANVFPAHLNVTVTSLDYIPDVANYFRSNDLIEEVKASENIVPKLRKIVSGVQIFGGALLAVFTISTIFIVFLAVGITIYSKKDEIIIMKLVGATNWYVQSPYLVQGLFYSFVSILIASIILGPLLLMQYDHVMSMLLGSDAQKFPKLTALVLAEGISVELLFGTLLALFSTYFATRRYINRQS